MGLRGTMAQEGYIHALRDGPGHVPGGPLLFAFHGTGGDELQFLDAAVEAMPEARVIAPRGDVSEGGALRFFRRTAEGIYDFEDLARRTEAMAAFVAAHRAPLPSATLGLGYSNGANILASVIDRYPGHFTHAVLMHPLVTWDIASGASLSGLSVLIAAGGRDPICPPERTGALAEALEARGARVRVWWHVGGHEVTQAEWAAVAAWLGEVRASLEGPQTLQIRHEAANGKGRWFLRAGSGHEAEMTYSRVSPERIIVDHTGVPDVFRGQGVGERLYRAMVETARREGWRVIPLCPFAAAQFRRHPEDADVLAERP